MLNNHEEEYVRLLVKRDTIVEDYSTIKDRPDSVKKRVQAVKDSIKKKKKSLDKAGARSAKPWR